MKYLIIKEENESLNEKIKNMSLELENFKKIKEENTLLNIKFKKKIKI